MAFQLRHLAKVQLQSRKRRKPTEKDIISIQITSIKEEFAYTQIAFIKMG